MQHGHQQHDSHSQYKHFGIELLIESIIMFFVMYAMIDTINHLYLNTNNVYMTLMMVAPMAVVMMIAMRHMFTDKKLNMALYAFFIIVFVIATYALRTQALVGDKQFLRAMIPHHSGAVLMCQRATITDPEIITLCKGIVEGQEREIKQMQAILQRY